MSRLDTLAGGFGGARVVKPQDNVYTVLLLIACLFVAAALGMELYRFTRIKDVPGTPAPTSVQKAAAVDSQATLVRLA